MKSGKEWMHKMRTFHQNIFFSFTLFCQFVLFMVLLAIVGHFCSDNKKCANSLLSEEVMLVFMLGLYPYIIFVSAVSYWGLR